MGFVQQQWNVHARDGLIFHRLTNGMELDANLFYVTEALYMVSSGCGPNAILSSQFWALILAL